MVSQTGNNFRLATASSDGLRWTLRRNCSVTPAQLAISFALLSGVSMTVAVFFWFQGALLVLPFAALELAVLAASFVVYARHATDGERITVRGGELLVEFESAGSTRRCAFARDWVRIEPSSGIGLIEVCGGGQSVQVGRYLRADLRPVLAREIRQALRTG